MPPDRWARGLFFALPPAPAPGDGRFPHNAPPTLVQTVKITPAADFFPLRACFLCPEMVD